MTQPNAGNVRGCEFCGIAVVVPEKWTPAMGPVVQLNYPWPRCPDCVQIARESEITRRRRAFLADVLGTAEPLPVSAGQLLEYWSDRHPPGQSRAKRWQHIDVKTLRRAVDEHIAALAPAAHPDGPCGVCGVTVAHFDRAERLNGLPVCTACLPLFIAGGSALNEQLREYACADALGLTGPWQGIAAEFQFRVFAEAWPDGHDGSRRWGWISQEDLASAHAHAVQRFVGYARDPAETARVRTAQQRASAEQLQRAQASPPPTFTVPQR